jgi:hypothetical protein
MRLTTKGLLCVLNEVVIPGVDWGLKALEFRMDFNHLRDVELKFLSLAGLVFQTLMEVLFGVLAVTLLRKLKGSLRTVTMTVKKSAPRGKLGRQ